ncbi:hypothetical protein BC628DRAFT_636584 [Trametes gibbosa]|nr:hypothetical protein BC628DRAFT_636584 [Trametes gibbosa]
MSTPTDRFSPHICAIDNCIAQLRAPSHSLTRHSFVLHGLTHIPHRPPRRRPSPLPLLSRDPRTHTQLYTQTHFTVIPRAGGLSTAPLSTAPLPRIVIWRRKPTGGQRVRHRTLAHTAHLIAWEVGGRHIVSLCATKEETEGYRSGCGGAADPSIPLPCLSYLSARQIYELSLLFSPSDTFRGFIRA